MLLGILTCKEALRRLDDYIDRELTTEEMEQVARHLHICHACTQKFTSETHIMAQLRAQLDRLQVPSGLMKGISETLTRERESIREKTSGP